MKMIPARSPEEPARFGGVFYSCASERGHECYHLSSPEARYLSESAEGVPELVMSQFVEPKPIPPIRRNKR